MGKLILKFQKGRMLSAEVDGVRGPSCLDETKKFLDGLRIDPSDFKDEHKPECDEEPIARTEGQL